MATSTEAQNGTSVSNGRANGTSIENGAGMQMSGFPIVRLFLDVFPQLSSTQVGETLSFSKKKPLSFSENSLSLFKRTDFFSKIP